MKTKSDKFKIDDQLKVAIESTQGINLDHVFKAEKWAWIGFVISFISMMGVLFISMSTLPGNNISLRYLFVIAVLVVSASVLFLGKNTGTSTRIKNIISILRGDIDSDIVLTPAMVYQNLSELVRRVVLAEQVFFAVRDYEHHTESDLKHFDGRVIVAKQNLDTFIVNMKYVGIPCDQRTRQSHFDRWAPKSPK